MAFEPERAVARIPNWILGLATAGTIAAGYLFGVRAAGGFLLGSIGAWINFRLLVRAVDRIGNLATRGSAAAVKTAVKPRRAGLLLFIQLSLLVLAALVILGFTGFRMVAVLCGILVCPAAVILEILYELVTYEQS